MRSRFNRLILMVAVIMLIAPIAPAYADDALPDSVASQVSGKMSEVGKATYRKFGLRIYNISLWAPGGTWSADKPYALMLRYTHSVSKDTMVDTVADDIRDQQVADDATIARWQQTLNETLPAVDDGDVLIGLSIPGQKALLFFNGKKIGTLEDLNFSCAFFNIWLGDKADEDMRNALLGRAE